jgi:DNA/RNA-binding domain of Phe-tRNA-synthetase-like protein
VLIQVAEHPLLELRAFSVRWQPNLAAYAQHDVLGSSPAPDFPAPDDALRAAVRDVLRHAGFKPTGRSKPSSEYLLRAHAEGALRPINCAVDLGNWVSFCSGFPISVVDAASLSAPLRVAAAQSDASYVFNASGQSIDVAHLSCLHDAHGACANAVKDAQRTKTGPETTETLSLIWGSRAYAARCDATLRYYQALLAQLGVSGEPVTVQT